MKQIFSIILFFLCNILVGQTRISFVDSVTNEPIPYVHIIYGDCHGKYSDEKGYVILPDDAEIMEISHISYEKIRLDIRHLNGHIVYLNPVVTVLPPAIVLPYSRKKVRIGYAYEKRISTHEGRNGCSIAEFFGRPENGESTLIYKILLNLNTINLKRSITVMMGDTTYFDGIMYVAKLRIDLRNVSQSGCPGESLINGGIIYALKDQFNLRYHKVHSISLPQPLVFPEEGIFVVVEWIVTENVREQDSVSPSIWQTQAVNGTSSWIKWPLVSPWRKMDTYGQIGIAKAFGIGLEISE